MNRHSFAVNAPVWLCITSPHYAAKPTSNYEAKERMPAQLAAIAEKAATARAKSEEAASAKAIERQAEKEAGKARDRSARDALSRSLQAARKAAKVLLTPEERKRRALEGFRRWQATRPASPEKRKRKPVKKGFIVPEGFITMKQAIAITGRSTAAIGKAALNGSVEMIRNGGRVYYGMESLKAYVARVDSAWNRSGKRTGKKAKA